MNSSSIRERKIHAEAVFIDVSVWQNLHSSQSTTNHKLQEAGLQWRNDFQKAFAHCRDCVQQNYLENWTLWAVPVSIITQVDTFYYYLLCYRVFFQSLLLMCGWFWWISDLVWPTTQKKHLATQTLGKSGIDPIMSGYMWIRKRAWNTSCCSLLLIFYLQILFL